MGKGQDIKKWVISTVVAMIGGGLASSIAALSDPLKYRFPQDLGTGKMWPFFLTGAGLTFVGLLLHSPIGQKVIALSKQSKEQLEQTQKELNQAKADLKGKQP